MRKVYDASKADLTQFNALQSVKNSWTPTPGDLFLETLGERRFALAEKQGCYDCPLAIRPTTR